MYAYNFARRLKTLRGLTPYEYIITCWQNEPERFIINPSRHKVGLNTRISSFKIFPATLQLKIPPNPWSNINSAEVRESYSSESQQTEIVLRMFHSLTAANFSSASDCSQNTDCHLSTVYRLLRRQMRLHFLGKRFHIDLSRKNDKKLLQLFTAEESDRPYRVSIMR